MTHQSTTMTATPMAVPASDAVLHVSLSSAPQSDGWPLPLAIPLITHIAKRI